MKIQCRAGFAARAVVAAFLAGAVAGSVMTMASLNATPHQQTMDNAATLELTRPHEVTRRLGGGASSAASARPPGLSGTGQRVAR